MLTFLVDEPPPFATPTEVADGVLWVRLPVPYSLAHVNIYLLEDEGGWTAVDAGVDDAATREAWTRVLSGLGGARALRRIFLTHHHADHAVASGWLQELTGAEVLTSAEEWTALGKSLLADPPDTPDRFKAHLMRMGCDPAEAEALRLRSEPVAVPPASPPRAWVPVAPGATLSAAGTDWRVIGGAGGHSPAPLSLSAPARGLLLAGDQLLPTMSPYVGVRLREPEASPVRDYLAYLDLIEAEVADETLVLPGHGLPFRGAPFRIDSTRKHHRRRCDLLAEACADAPMTVRELVDVVFRARGLEMLPLTVADTLSHLNLLRGAGRLEAFERGGVLRWRLLGEPGPALR